MTLPHVISAKDFTRAQLDALFIRASEVKEHFAKNYYWTEEGKHIANPLPPTLAGRIMLSLFDQPSTRTVITFENAMELLGGRVRPFRNMTRESSLAKDEPFTDTFETASGSAGVSVIVLRHPEAGAAERAAKASSVPIINAGDGTEHPTQALIDLFTIQEALGSIEGKRVCFVGDMSARTAKSLLYALTLYQDLKIWFVSPLKLDPKSEVYEYLKHYGRLIIGVSSLIGLVESSDIIYVLRPQQENWHKDIKNPKLRDQEVAKDLKEYYGLCTVDNLILARMPKTSIVLHPRPRGPELPAEVDSDPRVLHTVQGRNGGPVRIALLEMMHSGEWQRLATPPKLK